MKENQKIGVTSAAKHLNWPVGRFSAYYYRGKAPKYRMIDNQPVWEAGDLDEWKLSFPFKGKGRPRKGKA